MHAIMNHPPPTSIVPSSKQLHRATGWTVVFLMVTLVSGCPGLFPPSGACATSEECVGLVGQPVCVAGKCVECATATDCDDDDTCTTDTCEEVHECVHTAISCDDDDACTVDTCDAAAGCAHTDIECPLCSTCVDGACEEFDGCASDADCDDGEPCTTEACVDCLCESTDVDCDDRDPCTTDSCDAAAGCVHAVFTCPAGEQCVDGACTPTHPCRTVADCDDGLFCNGTETCADGACVPGADPCDRGAGTPCAGILVEECAEGDTSAICTCTNCIGGPSLTLNQDCLIGTDGDDTFVAALEFEAASGRQVATLQTGDTGDGLAGTDTLSATFNTNALTVVPTLSGIEVLNVTAFDDVTINGTSITGVTTINSLNSVDDVTVNNLANIVDAGLTGMVITGKSLNLAFLDSASNSPTTGSADALDFTVSETSAGTLAVTTATNGFEILNVISSGGTDNTVAAITQKTGTTLATANFTGSTGLTIKTMPNTVLTYAASGMTAGLQLGSGTDAAGSGTTYTTFATANLENVKTGSGDDVVIFNNTLDGSDASGTSELIDLGAGTDVVQASFSNTLGTPLKLRNVEEVRFNATASSVSVNLEGVTGLTGLTSEADGTANTFTFLNVPGTPALNFRGNNTQTTQLFDSITYTSSSATGAADTLTINVNNRGTPINVGTATTNVHTVGSAALTAANIETVNVTVTDGPAIFSGITAAAATTFGFTSSNNLTLGTVAGGTTTSVAASGVTGNFSGTFPTLGSGAQVTLGKGTFNTLSIAGSGGVFISVTGGSGADTITGSAQADFITGGPGNDIIIGGAGSDMLAGGPGSDTFAFNTIILAANAKTISDFAAGAGGDILRFDATTFTDYASGATVTFIAGGAGAAGLTVGVDSAIVRDTAANILLTTPAAGAQAVVGIATDTGNIYYDDNGSFTAGAVIIGNIPTAQVATLVAANIVIVP